MLAVRNFYMYESPISIKSFTVNDALYALRDKPIYIIDRSKYNEPDTSGHLVSNYALYPYFFSQITFLNLISFCIKTDYCILTSIAFFKQLESQDELSLRLYIQKKDVISLFKFIDLIKFNYDSNIESINFLYKSKRIRLSELGVIDIDAGIVEDFIQDENMSFIIANEYEEDKIHDYI